MIEKLYDRLFDLRNAQANCSVLERAKYEIEIAVVMAAIRKLEK